jgi:hypothetical protein
MTLWVKNDGFAVLKAALGNLSDACKDAVAQAVSGAR